MIVCRHELFCPVHPVSTTECRRWDPERVARIRRDFGSLQRLIVTILPKRSNRATGTVRLRLLERPGGQCARIAVALFSCAAGCQRSRSNGWPETPGYRPLDGIRSFTYCPALVGSSGGRRCADVQESWRRGWCCCARSLCRTDAGYSRPSTLTRPIPAPERLAPN